MNLFEKTILCANFLNGLSPNDPSFELPSKNKRLVWSKNKYDNFLLKLEEIKTHIKYDEIKGSSYESYEHLGLVW